MTTPGRAAGVDRCRVEAVAELRDGDGSPLPSLTVRLDDDGGRATVGQPGQLASASATRRRERRQAAAMAKTRGRTRHCSRAVQPAWPRCGISTWKRPERAPFPRGNGRGRVSRRRRRAAAPPQLRGQLEHERRRAGPARDRDGAAHPPRQLPGDRQPEAATGCLAALDPVEALEDALEMLGAIPGPSSSTTAPRGRPGARPAAARSCRRGCGRARSRRVRGRSAARAPRRRPPTRRRRRRLTRTWPGRVGERAQLLADDAADLPSPTSSCSIRIRPASIRERSSRSVASLVSRSTCARVVARNSRRVRLVQVLVRQQLQEPREREQRRPELVGGVGDEFLPGAVELRELDPHPVERRGQLSKLVGAAVDDRLVERALRDPVRGSLEATDPAGMDRGDGEPEDERDEQGGHGRVQKPPFDELDRRELIGERARQQHHVARREERHRHLRVLPSLVAGPGTNGPRPFERRRAPSSPSRSRCCRRPTSRRARAAPGPGEIPRRRRRRPSSWRRIRRRPRNRPAAADSAPRCPA